jgi:hypothetical protein
MENAAELASERVTALMTATEKAALEKKAKHAGMSVGEFVRRSVDAFDPDEAIMLAQLGALALEVQRSSRAASDALDQALADIAETKAQLHSRTVA